MHKKAHFLKKTVRFCRVGVLKRTKHTLDGTLIIYKVHRMEKERMSDVVCVSIYSYVLLIKVKFCTKSNKLVATPKVSGVRHRATAKVNPSDYVKNYLRMCLGHLL